MLMADVLMWLLIAVAFVAALPALWMLDRALWPSRFERKRAAADRSLFVSFLIGLIPAAITLALSVAGGKKLGLAVVFLIGFAFLWGFLGSSGIVSRLGAQLWPVADPWRQSRNGGLVLTCSALLPVVGWFVILPLIAIVGMGIQVRSRFGRATPSVPAPAPDVEVPES